MDVFKGHAAVPKGYGDAAVTIGNFDGVHLGHRALLGHAIDRARALGRKTIVYTFEPHPVRILNPSLSPLRITPDVEKVRLIGEVRAGAFGVDAVVVEPFTREFAGLSPDDFVAKVLVSALAMKQLIVGYDFSYGKGGAGNTASLAQAAQSFGFILDIVSQQTFDGVVASSTKIREFLLSGQVDGARLLLGRDYSLVGTVVHGQKRGRTIGFPTANVRTDYELVPRYGVYACRVSVGAEIYGAVTNVGVRPTVEGSSATPTIEAHLFDFEGDLYDREVRVAFVSHIREERKFSGFDALKAQIALDAGVARERLRA
ncbi:MAG: bifunctional riboflavin kinase/FAD synthetase [Deltaproteobacteria bacterium]|nr:bifunctional riboflavin kinase/FAD synthetase [Deltaproteobacteria bacterium]